MNYGEGYLGNDQDRINEIETDADVLPGDNLVECLEYYKKNGNLEPLENAIFEAELNRYRLFTDLVAAIKELRKTDNTNVANFLCKVRDRLKN